MVCWALTELASKSAAPNPISICIRTSVCIFMNPSSLGGISRCLVQKRNASAVPQLTLAPCESTDCFRQKENASPVPQVDLAAGESADFFRELKLGGVTGETVPDQRILQRAGRQPDG